MKFRRCLGSFLIILSILSADDARAGLDYTHRYLEDKAREEVNSRLDKEIARKRFSLKHSAPYYYEMGNKFKEQGNLREAVRNYEYAIFLDSKSSGNYYSSLAEIYYFLGQFSESSSYLRVALKHPFPYRFDKMKAVYLLVTDYFRLKQDVQAIELLKELTVEYQREVDRQAIDGLNIKYEYYAPAFFLLGLYYRNNGTMAEHPKILEKALQLEFKKEYTNYFLYEMYQNQGQDGIAWEYLKRAKSLQPDIEKRLKSDRWMKTYDLYSEIVRY